MEKGYGYFERDISWLSFNYRVLLEADDRSLPLYERINFVSIYSSNLEEFYQIRVAEHRAALSGGQADAETLAKERFILQEINEKVNAQLEDRIRIYEQEIVPELARHHVIFYQGREVEDVHRAFIVDYFREEIFPYLQPVPVDRHHIRTFLRNNRLYLAVRVYLPEDEVRCHPRCFVFKLPYSKVPRFVELPFHNGNYYLMFMEEIIKANIGYVFPGMVVGDAY